MADASEQVATVLYVLHAYPRATDSFIQDELRVLHEDDRIRESVLSIWRPEERVRSTGTAQRNGGTPVAYAFEGKRDLLSPGEILSFLRRDPGRVWRALRLALRVSPPGLRHRLRHLVYLRQAFRVASHAERIGATHLHNHFADHTGTVTMLACVLGGCEFSLSIHGPHLFMNPDLAALIEKVTRARFVRVIGDFCRSQVVLYTGCRSAEFVTVRCGIDLEAFRSRPRQAPGPTPVLFTCARLAPEKGMLDLLDAVRLLRDRAESGSGGGAPALRIAGDGPLREEIEDYVRTHDLAGVVTLLGMQTRAQILAELARADAFVLASYAEGIPVSLMEAMAVGVPVISTYVGGIAELVLPGETGLLVPPSSPEGLASAIATTLEDPEQTAVRTGRAQQYVRRHFDLWKQAPVLGAAFARVCGATSPREQGPGG